MHARAEQRLHLETDLRKAVERNEFRLYYQPIVALDDQPSPASRRSSAGSTRAGLLEPIEFLAVAEESGVHGAASACPCCARPAAR